MAEKYDVGTPLGGERKSRRLHSPLQEMDGIAPTTPRGAFVPVPPLPNLSEPAGEEAPVTLAAIASLLSSTLDAKLGPVSQTMTRLEEDFEGLKKEMTDHEKMVQSNVDNIASRVAEVEVEVKNVKESCREEFQKLRESLASATGSFPPSVMSTPRSMHDGFTAVFGGFRGASSTDEVEKWVSMALSDAGAPRPTTTYIKGGMSEFNGVAFGKYTHKIDRDEAVEKVKKANLEYAGQKVWAKLERPLHIRVQESILFGAKTMLTSKEWGFHRKAFWVDTDAMSLTCGENDIVMEVYIKDNIPQIVYGPGWEEFLNPIVGNTFWADVQKSAKERLSRAEQPSKGLGKGKGKTH